MRLHLSLIGMLLSSLWFSCSSRELKQGVSAETAFPPTFSAIRDRILIPRCGSCHELVASRNLLLKSYVVPGKPEASELFVQVESGEMPEYGEKLMDEEIAAIRSWIENGAPND